MVSSRRITLALTCALIGLHVAASAQPVIFDVTTSTGNDTLYAGIPGSIIWTVDANGASITALTFPMGFTFSSSGTYNLIGPVQEGTNFFFDEANASVFENRPFNSSMGADFVDAPFDTLLWGLLDFGGTQYTGAGPVCRLTFAPTTTGTIVIDTALLAPANHLSALNDQAQELPIVWNGPHTITVIHCWCPPPVFYQCGEDVYPNPAVFGDFVQASFVAYDAEGGNPPYSYFVAEAANSNGTGPNNWPTMVGVGSNAVFQWQTSSLNANDVGLWEFTVGVHDNRDTAYCRFEMEVIAETPFVLSIDTLTTYSDADASVCINMVKDAGLQIAGGLDLLICYDASVLTFTSATIGQALIDHGWEYWTYRLEETNPGKIRIVAIADMNNSNHHPDDQNPVGPITCLNFHTSNDRTVACQKAPIRFCWEDCGDNTVASRDGNTLYVASHDDGGIIDVSGEQIMCTDPDPWGYNASVVCAGCPSDKYAVDPYITYRNGSIRIICPGEIDGRGDLNFNGIPYEIADAVVYSNVMIWGLPIIPSEWWEALLAASDINADGRPLTVTDLVMLMRIISGDVEPIPDGIGGPKLAGIAGQIVIATKQTGSSIRIATESDQSVGATLFVFKYDGTGIASVTTLGRANRMDLNYRAHAGELRVLLYDLDSDHIKPGVGEILEITTTGGGSAALVSVEAATYDGRALESEFARSIVPSSFALHQNYPNPFNPTTTLAADFPAAIDYTLTIYNISGQAVRHFTGAASAGRLEITWDGRSDDGNSLGSGVYFYRLRTGDHESVRKMVLMK